MTPSQQELLKSLKAYLRKVRQGQTAPATNEQLCTNVLTWLTLIEKDQ